MTDALDKQQVPTVDDEELLGHWSADKHKVEDPLEHEMHAEWGELSAETASRINATRKGGGRVVAVGTTSLKVRDTTTVTLTARDSSSTQETRGGLTVVFSLASGSAGASSGGNSGRARSESSQRRSRRKAATTGSRRSK